MNDEPVKARPKDWLPRSLFGRSLIILITPIILIQIISTAVFLDRHWTKTVDQLAYAVVGEIAVISNVVRDRGEWPERVKTYMHDNLELHVTYNPDASWPVSVEPGALGLWESLVAETLREQLDERLNMPYVIDLDFTSKDIDIWIGLENGVLHVGMPQRRLFSSSGYIFLLWMAGTSLILLLIAIAFMRNQVRPIRRLAVAAEKFGRGEDVPSFKPQGAREIRQASDAFLVMKKRITRQIEQRTAMLAGISHDLRTPLTRLKLQLSMMENKHDVTDMKTDVDEMEKMIAGYLDFVRGEGEEGRSQVNLNEVLQKLLEVPLPGFDGNRHLQAADEVMAKVKPLAFERALNNLIINAGKHARKQVLVTMRQDATHVFIDIEDDGPGVPRESYEDLFKPFFRLEASRNKDTGGIGLGLPIAKDIINGHGGRVWLSESAAGGLKVSVKIPL